MTSRENGNSHPAGSAAAAGLRYVTDAAPGLSRRRNGAAFRYADAHGKRIRDAEVLARIRSLAIPPAWHSVWICPRADGHLQATGRDARGRKQYRYHPRWHEVRDETKYGRLAAFGRALPRIRRRVKRDLALPGLPRDKVLATIVRLLEATRIRVGNAEYARHNDSFGLTTMRVRQVHLNGATMRFRFRGKSGVMHDVAHSDRHIAAIVRRIRDLPGYELFQYVGDDGATRAVDSADVNDYLRAVAGEEFTSKDFRTWAGTVLAARALGALGPAGSTTDGKRKIAQAIALVASQLGNTAAVCRKCYIHPAVLDAYLEGELPPTRRVDAEAWLKRLLSKRPRRAKPLSQLLARSLRRLRTGTRLARTAARSSAIHTHP